MGINMGLGLIGGPDIVFKRKYRWTFDIVVPCGLNQQPVSIGNHVVKLAARPNLSIEETEINFLHGKMWIPGKGTWETITVTYYDIANDNTLVDLYSWLATVYDFTRSDRLYQSSRKGNLVGIRGYAGYAALTLYDGCGEGLELWELKHVWPQAINFGELDYSSSEEVTVELTLRYAEVDYTNLCGPAINRCCDGCGPGTGG